MEIRIFYQDHKQYPSKLVWQDEEGIFYSVHVEGTDLIATRGNSYNGQEKTVFGEIKRFRIGDFRAASANMQKVLAEPQKIFDYLFREGVEDG